jgi:hypothetical protein
MVLMPGNGGAMFSSQGVESDFVSLHFVLQGLGAGAVLVSGNELKFAQAAGFDTTRCTQRATQEEILTMYMNSN